MKTESIFIYSYSLAYKYSYKEGTNCSEVAKHQHAVEQGACKMAGQFGGIMLYSCMTDKTETGLAGTLTVITDSASFTSGKYEVLCLVSCLEGLQVLHGPLSLNQLIVRGNHENPTDN